MEDLKQIQEFFLNENVYMEAYKLEKALNGMGYKVKVKYLDDFGKDVFEIYSKKPLDGDSIFYDAKKLGYPNARVFDHSNESVSEDNVDEANASWSTIHSSPPESDLIASDIQKAMNQNKGDEAIIHQLKIARRKMNVGDLKKAKEIVSRYLSLKELEKGYSPQLVSPKNPKGETDGLTTDTMNKILMKVIQDLDELKQLGEGMIEEKLCKKGKAYIKRRKAAGEKSSAYLSGRAVKVCKGQMSGRKKRKSKKK